MPEQFDSEPRGTPVVSVIVPARNEELSLAACLGSLVSQTEASFEIIVVDDHSSDRTRDVAESFSSQNVQVIEADPLGRGWTGKNNAVSCGARIARGQWLLFTDADTVHLPGSLARSLDEARSRSVDLLSYSPQQVVETFWEKAVMPVIFAELAATFSPSEVSDPNSPAAAANGQYILITREAYRAVGGHAAIAGDLLEDVALARAVKTSGRMIFFRFAADAVRTRMYRTFAHLREGWTKNLALLFPSATRLAVVRCIEFALLVAALIVSFASFLTDRPRIAAVAVGVFLVMYAFLLARIRRAHFDWDATLLSIFGLPLFSWLLLRSKIFHRRGNVSWKGRTYPDQAKLLAPGH
jgi:GT2 family glycosyltransferase